MARHRIREFSKNRRFWAQRLLVRVSGALGVLGLGWVLGVLSATPARAGAESPHALLLDVGRVLVLVERLYVEPVARERLVRGAVKGMVAELDPHSDYLTPKEFQELKDDTAGRLAGIGVEIDYKDDVLTVVAPIEGSPAERAGIKSGDVIVMVDDTPIDGTAFSTIVKKMRGEPGTTVTLIVRRKGEPKPLRFSITRAKIHVPSVVSKGLDRGVGYLRVKQFQDGTHRELLQHVATLRKRPGFVAAGAIVDLRSNPGGLVDEASDVADEMLASGTIYTARHRGRIVDAVSAHAEGALVDVPLVVLVDEWTASAAELVAGAAQDHHRALIVGANTFGKGSVQSIMELPGGAGLRLTISRYYTPAGHPVQAHGIHPDVLVDVTRDPNVDIFPTLRERSIEGHLPAEGTPPEPSRTTIKGPSVVIRNPREIPSDPTQGPDLALRTAYESLVRRLGRAAGPAPSP